MKLLHLIPAALALGFAYSALYAFVTMPPPKNAKPFMPETFLLATCLLSFSFLLGIYHLRLALAP